MLVNVSMVERSVLILLVHRLFLLEYIFTSQFTTKRLRVILKP